MNDELKAKLMAIFPNAEERQMRCEPNGADLLVHYTAMYERPDEPNERHGKALQALFGSTDVRLQYDTVSESGCESCDWGSQYGWDILIVAPTNRNGIALTPTPEPRSDNR